MSILSRIGIGSATIDLIPDDTTVRLGGQINASLQLKGGSSTQTAEDIEIALITQYKAEGAEGNSFWKQYGLWKTEIEEEVVVRPDDDRTVDVPPIQVPRSSPVTLGETRVWIQTALDINWSVDPSDVDQIEVQPNALLQGVLDALEEHLDLRLLTVENVESTSPISSHPFVQQFTFDGGDGPFAGAFDHLAVAPVQADDKEGLDLLFQIDRLGNQSVGDTRDGHIRIESPAAQPMADRIRDEIERRL